MKNFIRLLIIIFGLFLAGCHPPPDCEVYDEGDVTFHDDGPSWVWDGCYIEVDWSDGGSNSVLFYGTKSYYDKSAGRADVYMEWEDADSYYWDYGHITVIQCGLVDAYCVWTEKKSAVVSGFVIERSGQILKSEVASREDFRKGIKLE